MQDIIVFMQQHWTLSTALLIVFVLLICLEFIKQKRGATKLSPGQVTHLINHKNAAVIDLQNTEGYNAGHIVGAVSIPLSELREKSKKIVKYKSQPIVLTCPTGLESQRIAPELQKEGYDVHILDGGIRGWKAAGLPLVKS